MFPSSKPAKYFDTLMKILFWFVKFLANKSIYNEYFKHLLTLYEANTHKDNLLTFAYHIAAFLNNQILAK